MSTTHRSTFRYATLALTAIAVTGAGCKSGGGSRWAWNPWAKSSADAAAIAQSEAQSDAKLPSDGATPQVEMLGPKTSTTAVAAAAPAKTPPALEGVAPKFDAVASAVPTIEKEAPTSPNWTQYPTSPSANPTPTTPSIAAAKTAPPAMATATAMPPSTGPYNPNGYQPQIAAASTKPSTDRYGLGDRYGAATPSIPDLPSAKAAATTTAQTVAQTATQTADRYGAAAAATTAGNWYDSAVASTTPASPSSAAPVVKPAMATPAPAAAPAPAYPTTTSVAAAAPAASPYPTTSPATTGSPYPSTMGSLPPAQSAFATTTPVTSAGASTATKGGSQIRLTSLPGEYRPGGTSTYQSPVSIATRPKEATTTTSPSTTTPSRY